MRALLLPLFLFSLPGAAQAAPRDVIEGAVLESSSGRPIAGATVVCGDATVITDASGRFRIKAAGETVAARAPGYLAKAQDTAFPPELRLTPFTPRALYLSFYGAGSRPIRGKALKLLEETELNALVIDVKGDRGMLSYRSGIPLAAEIGAQKIITVKDIPGMVRELKAKGIYTIARVVAFKDDKLALARPEMAIRNGRGEIFRDNEGLAWIDPFRSEGWDYILSVAEEAAKAGFDEIQFDYIRFPDKKGLVFSRENTEENRVQAVSGFLGEARERLGGYNVYISADVFGYIAWNENDTWIGQHLETLAPLVDYLAPMLYPSGFQFGVGQYKNPVKNPYEVVLLTLNKARNRTGLPPVRFRPWLQAFRDYAFDRREFGAQEIRAQLNAAREFGANGYMLWNPRNVYSAEGIGMDVRAQVEAGDRVR